MMKKKQATMQRPFFFPLWEKYFTLKEQVWLFVLVTVGMVLRIINAVAIPLWRDEIYIFYTARDNSLWKLITQQHWDTAHPPLHSVFLHFWQMISVNPLWLRLPSLIASFFILYLLPLLVIKITKKHKSLPFIFLFFFSFSHTQISLDMVVRPYPFVSLFIIISLILFFELLNQKKYDIWCIVKFGLINFLAIQTDYSTVWLFTSYFVFYTLYSLFNRDKIRSLRSLFRGLVLSAILSLSVFPFLFGKIDQSLQLEQYLQAKFDFSGKGVISGSPIHIHISDKHISFFDDSFNLISESILPQPFLTNNIYLGLNLPPFTTLFINDISVCGEKRVKNIDMKAITNTFRSCKNRAKDSLISIKDVKSRGVIGTVIRNTSRSFFINGKNSWETPTSLTSIRLQSGQDIFLSLNAFNLSLFDGPGLNVYNSSPPDDGTWNNVQRLTISTKRGFYNAHLHNQSIEGAIILSDKNPFKPFIGDIYFLTNSPEILYESSYFVICLIVLCLFLCSSLYLVIKSREKLLTLFFTMIFVPVVASFIVSYYGYPIFIAKNLFIVNIAYIFLSSLVISNIGSFTRRHIKTYIIIATVWMLIFFLKFPYLHFVDPPYDFSRVVQEISKQGGSNAYIIVENENFYFPLFTYGMQLNHIGKSIPAATAAAVRDSGKLDISLKQKYHVFFIHFGLQKKELGNEFLDFKHKLNCNLKEMKFDYIYFARCD